MKTNKPKIDNIEIEVLPHSEASKDYCVLSLKADFDGKTYSEAIAVYQDYLFKDIEDDDQRKMILNEIISKLSSELLDKYYGLSKNVKKNVNSDTLLKEMKGLYGR